MEKKKIKKEVLEWLLIIITGIIINVFGVLLFAFTSNASSGSDSVGNKLPYIVSSHTALNTITEYSGYESMINSALNKIATHSFTKDIDYDTITFKFSDYNANTNTIYYYFAFDCYVNSSLNQDSFDVTLSNLTLSKTPDYIYRSTYNFSNGSQGSIYRETGNFVVFGNYETITTSIGTYTPNYPFLIYGGENPVILDSSDNVVLAQFSQGSTIILGSAIPPQTLNNPEYSAGDTPPTTVPPSYTYNTYTWNTYNSPSIDNSTLETLVESLINSVVYLGEYLTNNLKNEFSNLTGNLSGFFQYIGKTIQYYGNNIISSINNGIQNFYDNMKSLVEPIFQSLEEVRQGFEEFADLFINPFDEEEFEEQMSNSDFLNAYDELMDNADDIRAIINNAEEREHFSLYISFENPLATTNHRIIQSEINFDWLVPLRSVYRPFLWVCTLIELFVGGARVLTHALGGDGI